MKEKFCEWYRNVCIDPTHEQLQNRWDSLQEYYESNDIDIMELVKLFFELPVEEQFKAEFIKPHFNKDMTFQRDNKREISLLAGTALMELLEDEVDVNKIILAIMCIAPFKQDVVISEVLDIVSEKLDDITSGIRSEKNTEQGKLAISDKGIANLAKNLETGSWSNESTINFSKILSQIANNFNILQSNQEKLQQSLAIYREDSDILSWLFGEWSNDLDKQLSKKINQSQISLVLGKELADLVKQIPGPYSAKAFLKKMLGHCKPDKNNITLLEIVDTLDEGWKKRLLDDYSIIKDGVNTPILLAVSKSQEVNDPNVWKHAYQKLTQINAEEVESDLLTWAYQIYLECLLVKVIICED